MRTGAALLCALLAAGCGRDGGSSFVGRSSALRKVEGCVDLEAQLRTRALARMNAAVDANLEMALRGGWMCAYPTEPPFPMPPVGPMPATPVADGAAGGAREFSGTNVQVPGVDEPDFVKTDGTWVYAVAGGRLQIVKAWPPAEASRVSTIAVEGTPKALLVSGDRAVVFSSLGESGPWTDPRVPVPMPPVAGGNGACTYGYDCVPRGDGRPLKVTVLDVGDRAAPRVVREATFSGSYLAARRIGDAVHAVIAYPERWIEGVSYWPPELGCGGGEVPSAMAIRAAFEALRAKNRALIEDADVAAWLPAVKDVRHAPSGDVVDERLLAACDGFYASDDADDASVLSVVSFAAAADAPLAATSIVGRPGFVYAGPDSLYVAAPYWWSGGPWFWEDTSQSEATTLHAFRLTPTPAAEYAGSGAVKGRVLNQFAMDDRGGDLRVAATVGRLPSSHNAVSVLRLDGAGLREVGRVDGIAPGEDIRAVRFDGDRGFMVTFRQVDPLFVLDLADPAAPRIAGELKVPGFSTYLHLVDPGHLLTIGFDVAEDGQWPLFQGLLLQIFDVSDPAAPKLAHRESIGTRGSGSEAATDHLAFTWFAPRGLLGVPLAVCDPFGVLSFSGLRVYRVGMDAGFTSLGGVAHPVPPDPYASGACWSWWARSTSLVKRSIFLEDFVLSFTDSEMRAQDTRALGTDVARVDFLAP